MKSKKRLIEIDVLPNGKKELTANVVKQDLLKQKNTVPGYLFGILWFGAVFAFSYFLNPMCFLCCIPMPFIILKNIRQDIRIRRLKYDVIKRNCIEKRVCVSDDSPDEYQLWFYNQARDWRVPVTVEKEYYDATQDDEEFYLVFVHKERSPFLWYRTSEWELNINSFENSTV